MQPLTLSLSGLRFWVIGAKRVIDKRMAEITGVTAAANKRLMLGPQGRRAMKAEKALCLLRNYYRFTKESVLTFANKLSFIVLLWKSINVHCSECYLTIFSALRHTLHTRAALVENTRKRNTALDICHFGSGLRNTFSRSWLPISCPTMSQVSIQFTRGRSVVNNFIQFHIFTCPRILWHVTALDETILLLLWKRRTIFPHQ